ncbi:MAG: hypothetical protein AW12_03137 [Candidatus Accumulibacter sp. BA-94]|nr:MAG: hypothetical protein AW12_03137 [Candidatus Accumulibacter sp. BA-94]
MLLPLGEDGVVEILRGGTVDGHQRQRTQVDSSLPGRRRHQFGQAGGFGQRRRRELEGQRVLAQRDLDLHSRIGVVAEHLDDASDRFGMTVGLLDDLDRHHRTGTGAGRLFRCNQDILVDPPVLGHHQRDAVLDEDAADDAAVGPLEHFDDDALAASASVDADDAHQSPVAMQHLRHLPRFERQILAAVIGNEKAVAVRVSLDPARNEAGALRQQVALLAVAQQLALTLHRPQAAQERAGFFPLDVEQAAQRIEGDRPALLAQHLQNVLARGQRLLVALLLALEIRIAPADRRQADY